MEDGMKHSKTKNNGHRIDRREFLKTVASAGAGGARAGAGRAIDPRRIGRVSERVDRQVRKGVRIMRSLNRLAHSLDNADGLQGLRMVHVVGIDPDHEQAPLSLAV